MKQQSSELDLLEDNRFKSPGSKISEIYVDKNLDHIKKMEY